MSKEKATGRNFTEKMKEGHPAKGNPQINADGVHAATNLDFTISGSQSRNGVLNKLREIEDAYFDLERVEVLFDSVRELLEAVETDRKEELKYARVVHPFLDDLLRRVILTVDIAQNYHKTARSTLDSSFQLIWDYCHAQEDSNNDDA